MRPHAMHRCATNKLTRAEQPSIRLRRAPAHRASRSAIASARSLYALRKERGSRMQELANHPERLEQTALLVESTRADLVASQDWVHMQRAMHMMSAAYRQAPPHPPGLSWEWGEVGRLVVLGLGSLDQAAPRQGSSSSSSVQRSSQRLHQLALALALPSLLPGLAQGPVFVEPEFSAWDCQLLSRLGGRPLALPLDQAWEVLDPPCPDLGHFEGGASASGGGGSAMPAAPPPHPSSAPCSPPSPLTIHSGLPGPRAPEPGPASPSGLSPSGTTGTDPPASGGQQAAGGGSRQAAGSGGQQEGQAAHRVLLYMPCCPRTLYDQVLARQLAAGSLPSLALLGSSLAALGASAQLFKAFDRSAELSPPLLQAFCDQRAFVEAPSPDCAGHGVALGLHAFPPWALQRLRPQQ
ncbi:hypothetical protein V8C86DRAFT_2656095 [Haematococcus lacustris]